MLLQYPYKSHDKLVKVIHHLVQLDGLIVDELHWSAPAGIRVAEEGNLFIPIPLRREDEQKRH